MIEHKSSINSTLRLQHMIHEFKQQQTNRDTFENKLVILKQKCDSNKKKAKVIKNQLSKINNIKNAYQA